MGPWLATVRLTDRAALEALLAAVRPIAAGVTVLRLPRDEAAKQRFFVKGVGNDRLLALPDGRRSARELLVKLRILESAR